MLVYQRVTQTLHSSTARVKPVGIRRAMVGDPELEMDHEPCMMKHSLEQRWKKKGCSIFFSSFLWTFFIFFVDYQWLYNSFQSMFWRFQTVTECLLWKMLQKLEPFGGSFSHGGSPSHHAFQYTSCGDIHMDIPILRTHNPCLSTVKFRWFIPWERFRMFGCFFGLQLVDEMPRHFVGCRDNCSKSQVWVPVDMWKNARQPYLSAWCQQPYFFPF